MPEAFPSGSLGYHATQAVRSRVTGGNPSTDRAIWSSQVNNGPHTRNSSLWIGDLDLTCLPTWNVGHFRFNGILVTSKHIICAEHYKPGAGASVAIPKADGSLCIRTVSGSPAQIGSTDIAVVTLNADVDAGITPAKVLPANVDSILNGLGRDHIPGVVVNRAEKALVHHVVAVLGTDYATRIPDLGTQEQYFFSALVPGDSGSPLLWLINGELVVVGTAQWSSQGPCIHNHIAAINAITGEGYELQTVDLSGFTVPDNVPEPEEPDPPQNNLELGVPPPIKTIKPAGGGDYTTLAAWNTARGTNIWWAECYSGDVGRVDLAGTGSPADNDYIRIYAADGQTPYLTVGNSQTGIDITSVRYTRVEGIELRATGTNSAVVGVAATAFPQRGIHIDRCEFKASGGTFAVCISGGAEWLSGSVVARNLILNCVRAGGLAMSFGLDSEAPTVDILNNTLIGNSASGSVGIDAASGYGNLKNNIILGFPTALNVSGGTSSNNITSGTAADIWVDPSTSDELKAGSAAIGAGTNVSLDTDRVGVSYEDPPSIGSREYVAPASGTTRRLVNGGLVGTSPLIRIGA